MSRAGKTLAETVPPGSVGTRVMLSPRGTLGCAVAMIAAGLIYATALDNPFIYDDFRLIVENPSLNDVYNLRAIAWREITRPIVNFTYAVDRSIWGPTPFGFHLTNVLLHMLNVGLVFLLAWHWNEDWSRRRPTEPSRVVRPTLTAFAAALMLAVHPMMTEAVGYISGRSEVLSTTFFVLALLAIRRWFLGTGVGFLFVALAMWGCGLATKETVAMLPFVVLAYDRIICPGSDEDRARRWRRFHLPIFALASVFVVIRIVVLALVEYTDQISFNFKFLLVQFDVVRRYLTMLLTPRPQSIFHAIPLPSGLTDPAVLTGIAAIAGLIVVATVLRRREGMVSIGILWFLLLLVPSSALVVLDRGEPMAEHRVYLASVGLFFAIGEGIGWLVVRFARARAVTRWLLRLAIVLGVLTLCARTLLRNEIWASRESVWSEAVEQAPTHWLPHLVLGEAHHAAGNHDAAIASFLQSINLRPEQPAAYGKIGTCLLEVGDVDQARIAFNKMRELLPRSAEASNGLGTVALMSGQVAEARQRFVESLQLDPRNVQARRALAVIEETVGANPAEALRLCEEIREIAPHSPGNDDCIARNRARLATIRGGS
ncbi:MAG TPA: tetratricopeptide repeat protein [Vicinamibacterales bacterium]|nr:tetratricopeptide repeat protein [Vicinamibacterales bacterium]